MLNILSNPKNLSEMKKIFIGNCFSFKPLMNNLKLFCEGLIFLLNIILLLPELSAVTI